MKTFVRFYGAHPLHLVALLLSFALVGYVVMIAGPHTFWNRDVWWQSIAVWFLGAVVAHDLVLFPLYALADRVLPRRRSWTVSALNYIRIPALGTALSFAMFLPGILRQGGDDYYNATGLTQDPYLVRWLILVAALFGVSALAYAVRILLQRRRA